MRIQKIELTNYKAFLGTHKIQVGGKNLFIYGENGSGKSSLYYALKDFFQSSTEDIDLDELENAFVAEDRKGRTAIKVTFKPNSEGHKRPKTYGFDASKNDTRITADTSIRDGNKLKSFLTYKHLLGIHHLKKDEQINLFDLLVKGVLKHFKFSLTGGKELGELWTEVEASVAKATGRGFTVTQKRTQVQNTIKAFNDAFSELFKPDSPEYILGHARPILDQFNHNIQIDLRFPQVRPTRDLSAIEGASVEVELIYANKPVNKPHLFLNEARLSAIALSIYLGMIKRHIQGIPCKILFLDDVFIGLDISNRLPLLKILKAEFPDYQIFITTYDKPWFEYAKGFLEQDGDWKTIEFYARDCHDGSQMPMIVDCPDLLAKAKYHLDSCDYKAAAVYARSAFEKIIQNACEGNKAITYRRRLKDYTTEHFWNALKGDLQQTTRERIETYRSLVLNTFSHYNTERHEIRAELNSAIQAVEALKAELIS
jgi:recombinational DNA repair ATPase RecF